MMLPTNRLSEAATDRISIGICDCTMAKVGPMNTPPRIAGTTNAIKPRNAESLKYVTRLNGSAATIAMATIQDRHEGP